MGLVGRVACVWRVVVWDRASGEWGESGEWGGWDG